MEEYIWKVKIFFRKDYFVELGAATKEAQTLLPFYTQDEFYF